jgi:DNA-binding response OmpR family regulator
MSTRLLLVEDNELVGGALTEYLQWAGYEVHYASNGRAALEIAQHFPVDLVVSDIKMPGMSGYTLGHELRRLYRLPVLLMSGYQEPSDQADMATHDSFDFLAKPFTPDQLMGRICGLLNRSVSAC